MNIEDVVVLDQSCGVTNLETSARIEISMWIITHIKEHKNERLYNFAGRVVKMENEYNKPIGGKVYSTFLSDVRDDAIKKLFRDLYSILIRTPLINNEEIRLLLRDANV
jgi:hypothetical protein